MSQTFHYRSRAVFALVVVGGLATATLALLGDRPTAQAEEAIVEKDPATPSVDAAGKPLPTNESGWRRKLTRQQYLVLRQKATEPAFSGRYWKSTAPGTYRCAGCGKELFTSDSKFTSECGWPSFTEPLASEVLTEQEDNTDIVPRTEVVCTNCGGHLGHVFADGPGPGGLRYCINSLSLKFEKKETAKEKP
jgi:peptide-methionine (R)-S-oxide reductase